MNDHTRESSAQDTKDDGHRISGDGWFIFVIALLALILAGLLLFYGTPFFYWTYGNLPLVLPLAVTMLSIFTRAADIRNYESLLKISNDIAIGIISFDIWAISAKSSDHLGRVMVNPTTMISGDFVIPLLLSGLLISVGCVVLTHYKFSSPITRQRSLLIGFVTAIIVYVMPFGILEPAAHKADGATETRRFTVVIPYEDPALTRLAPSVLRDRLFVQFERDIAAKDQSEAEQVALKQFFSTDISDLYRRSKRDEEGKVVIKKSKVLVIDQQATFGSRK